MSNVVQLYNDHFDSYKEDYDRKNLSEENRKRLEPKQLKITGKKNYLQKHAELPEWLKSKQ